MLISLIEVTGVDASGTPTVFRYSDGLGYRHPSAPGPYEPRLVQPCTIHRAMFGLGTTSGATAEDYGAVVIANIDGGADQLKSYGFDGQSFRWLLVDDAAAYSTAVVALACRMGKPTFNWGQIQLTLRSWRSLFSTKVGVGHYGGSGGLEGSSSLTGQVRQRAFGRCYRVPCTMVDSTLHIFQASDGQISNMPANYLGGVGLTRGADYGSQAALQDAAQPPAAGQYRVWPAGGYGRLAAEPTANLYADVDGDATGGVWASTTADVFTRLADTYAPTHPTIPAADLTALNTAAPGAIGLLVTSDATLSDLFDQLAIGAGCWWGMDAQEQLRIGRFGVLTGTPVATFTRVQVGNPATATTGDIIEIDFDTTADAGDGTPPYRVEVSYAQSYTVVTFSDGTSSASTDERNFVARQFRTSSAQDLTVKSKHAESDIFSKVSLYAAKGDTDTEAARELALRKVDRDNLIITVKINATLAAVLDLGALVTVQIPRYGYDAGKPMLIRELEINARLMTAKLWLWG